MIVCAIERNTCCVNGAAEYLWCCIAALAVMQCSTALLLLNDGDAVQSRCAKPPCKAAETTVLMGGWQCCCAVLFHGIQYAVLGSSFCMLQGHHQCCFWLHTPFSPRLCVHMWALLLQHRCSNRNDFTRWHSRGSLGSARVRPTSIGLRQGLFEDVLMEACCVLIV